MGFFAKLLFGYRLASLVVDVAGKLLSGQPVIVPDVFVTVDGRRFKISISVTLEE